jgi:hypothetical protein
LDIALEVAIFVIPPLLPCRFSGAHDPDDVVGVRGVGVDHQQQDDACGHTQGVPSLLAVFDTIETREHKWIQPDHRRVLETRHYA